MFVIDDERHYVEANPAGCAMLGLPLEQLVGAKIDDFTPERLQPRLQHRWEDFMERGTHAGLFEFELPGGRDLNFEYSASANIAPGRHVAVYVDRGADGRLSPREREVMDLVAHGATSPEIAERLGISPETARTHARNAIDKLGARTRAHAVALALERHELAAGGHG